MRTARIRLLRLRDARVDEVHEQIRARDLFERRLERLDELVRQAAHEADRVGEQHDLAAGEPQAARARVQRREQPVLDEHLGPGQPVEQGGLAGVRVADERDVRERPAPPRLALGLARAAELHEVPLQLGDPPLDAPAIHLELGLTGTAGADAAPLLGQLDAPAAQARQPVAQLRELDLHHSFLAPRVLGEDVEDQRDAIDDVPLEQLLQVALLGR